MINPDSTTLILSPARTGSTYLARFIAQRFYDQHYFVEDPEVAKLLHKQTFVGRSHMLFDSTQLQDITVVFSIRENVADTVLSRILQNHHNTPYDSEIFLDEYQLSPISVDHTTVSETLYQLECWYQHYQHQLRPQDHVVSYEVFTGLLANNQHRKLNKTALVSNYDQVTDWINDRCHGKFADAHGKFVDCKSRPNRQHDIYSIFTS